MLSYAAAFARVNVLSVSQIFGAHRHWNSEITSLMGDPAMNQNQ